MMTDREWAITWIEAIKDKYIHGGDESYDDCRRRSIDMAIKALSEPEIVRCKNCKYHEPKGNCDYGYKPDEWYCADGVKRE